MVRNKFSDFIDLDPAWFRIRIHIAQICGSGSAYEQCWSASLPYSLCLSISLDRLAIKPETEANTDPGKKKETKSAHWRANFF